VANARKPATRKSLAEKTLLSAKTPQKIGLISDTHGVLRPEALEALRGSELIIHAGDVGDPTILQALRKIAPVVAVRGNVDTAPWANDLAETAVAEAGAVNIYVLHDVHALDLNARASGFHIVVSGHSHQPGRSERDGVLYLNPGSAGPRRFSLPITVARLHLAGELWNIEFITLPDRSRSGTAGGGRGLHGGRS